MKAIRKVFSNNLKRLRKLANLTQEDLAEKLNISVRYIQRLEGKNCPSVGIDRIAVLAKVLRVKSRNFFE